MILNTGGATRLLLHVQLKIEADQNQKLFNSYHFIIKLFNILKTTTLLAGVSTTASRGHFDYS